MYILNLKTAEIIDHFREDFYSKVYPYLILSTACELKLLKDILDIDEITFNDCLEFDENIKLDLFDNYDFLSLNTCELSGNEAKIEEVNMYLSDNFILVICEKDNFLYDYVKSMILNNSKIQKHYNPSNLFKISYLIIKNIIIHEFENLEKVEDMILDLEDEIMKLYGSSKAKKIAEKLDDDEEIKDKKLLKTIETSQQTLEMKNFGIRKSVLEYDNVINKQRELIYEDRRKVINGDDVSNHINEMIESEIKEIYNEYISDSIEKYIEAITTTFSLDKYNKELNLEDKKDNEIVDYTISVIKEVYKSREDLIGSEAMRDWERKVILHFVDNYWIDHIDAIEQLKKGIGLLAAGQKDPVKEFTVQSFDMFDDINKNINKDALKHLFA